MLRPIRGFSNCSYPKLFNPPVSSITSIPCSGSSSMDTRSCCALYAIRDKGDAAGDIDSMLDAGLDSGPAPPVMVGEDSTTDSGTGSGTGTDAVVATMESMMRRYPIRCCSPMGDTCTHDPDSTEEEEEEDKR